MVVRLPPVKAKVLILLFFLIMAKNPAQCQHFNIATYNIRFDNPRDTGNLWKDRSPHLFNLLRFHQIDLFGTQEGLYHQLEGIKDNLGFKYIGVGRDNGGKEGEFSAIFYNPAMFDLLDHGTFWLSETPNLPSKGWDAALNRICTWGQFEIGAGFKFFVFNIHYDHIGQSAREESSRLLIRKIAEITKSAYPVVLMGDFNVTSDTPAYQTIIQNSKLQDSSSLSKTPPIGNQGTFNGFDWGKIPDKIIDHVFLSPEFLVLRHGILTDNYGKKYPSDHFPVLVEIGWE